MLPARQCNQELVIYEKGRHLQAVHLHLNGMDYHKIGMLSFQLHSIKTFSIKQNESNLPMKNTLISGNFKIVQWKLTNDTYWLIQFKSLFFGQ